MTHPPARRPKSARIAPIPACVALLLVLCAATHSARTAGLSGRPETSGESPQAAQAPEPGPPEEESPSWTGSVAGNAYVFPSDSDFAMEVARADRGPLHLEARWNYEARDTGSLWAGWNWSKEGAIELEVTPMLGAVIGETDGIAPGFELSLGWKRLDSYIESELVYDLDSSHDSFTYAWSELGFTPARWTRVGLVAERTRLFDNGLSVQSGIFAQALFGPATLGVYWFNPGGEDTYSVLAASVEF